MENTTEIDKIEEKERIQRGIEKILYEKSVQQEIEGVNKEVLAIMKGGLKLLMVESPDKEALTTLETVLEEVSIEIAGINDRSWEKYCEKQEENNKDVEGQELFVLELNDKGQKSIR